MAIQLRLGISTEEAEQQFDQLFDEYFKDEPSGLASSTQGFGSSRLQSGGDVLESGSVGEEVDEVYIPEEQLGPEQVAQRQAICEVAQELRALGDRYAVQFGPSLARADASLTALFTHASGMNYETFQNAVESVTTTDRNVADFIFMMSLSRNVVSHVRHAANKAKNFFRRYIGNNYIPAVAEAGGVRQYVADR